MGRIYSVPWTGNITNAGGNADLWELTPADDKPIKIRGIVLAQKTELGDAAEESPRITITRLGATVTGGSGGSSVTPVPMDSADTAAGFAAEVNNTTVATTSGTTTVCEEFAWNIRNSPYEMWFPEDRYCFKCKGGEVLVVRLEDTVTDDVTFAGTLWVEEE